jgi:hypothetical protein
VVGGEVAQLAQAKEHLSVLLGVLPGHLLHEGDHALLVQGALVVAQVLREDGVHEGLACSGGKGHELLTRGTSGGRGNGPAAKGLTTCDVSRSQPTGMSQPQLGQDLTYAGLS